MLASARSASALEVSMISLNFWKVKRDSVGLEVYDREYRIYSISVSVAAFIQGRRSL